MLVRSILLFFLLLSGLQASLKNFADGVVSVKESGGTINTNDRQFFLVADTL